MSSSEWTSDESQAGSESEDNSGREDNNLEDDSTENGEALQLIKFAQQPASECSPKLELNRANLDKLLQSTEDRILCIISIVGPPRLGKSLLLNYIKLQLEAIEEGQKNFDLSNTTQHVTGFDWNSGMDPLTKGIWAWSRAFLIDTTEKDIAVLLLDSQGIDDEISTRQEISSILGLSFISSSILIYNVANDISSATFKSLLPFFKFGVCCKEVDDECSDQPPFQKISFLIRDWSNPSQYTYGSQDGKLLLKNKIKTLKGDVKAQTINVFRKQKCFHQYEAFLLPNVGQTALQATFTGCLTKLDSEFKDNLKSFINNLLKEENLLVKQILGVDVTPSEYANYMQEFVSLFNSTAGSITGEALFKTRCEVLHNNIVEKAMKKYHDVIDRKQKSCIYLNKHDLQALHENAERQAKLLFQKAKKLEDFVKEYERKFHNELKNAHELVQSINESSRKSHITECIGVAENVNRKALREKLIFEQNKLTIYDDRVIQQISDAARDSAIHDFIKHFPDEDQENLQNLKGTLGQVLLSILQPFLAENNENANKANAILVQKCSKIYQDYDTKMKQLITDYPFVEVPIISQAHLMNRGVALEAFDNFEKPVDEHMILQHRKHVETELEKLFHKYIEDQKLKTEDKMREGSTILQKQAKAYTDALRSKAQKVESTEELELIHNQTVVNITNIFKELNPFPDSTTQHEQLNTRLRDQLCIVYDIVKKEELDTKRRHEEKIKKKSMICVDLYKQEIDAFKANAEFFGYPVISSHGPLPPRVIFRPRPFPHSEFSSQAGFLT